MTYALLHVDTAFKQQRLKAWQPILTPKTVLPTFFIIGLLFVPLGAILLHVSNQVQEISFDYTDCDKSSSISPTAPVSEWSFDSSTKECTIKFKLDTEIKAPVFLYYRLTNFYQNHRRYVKSLNAAQLKGSAEEDLTACAPLDKNGAGVKYYPCGLIPNSIFNDTIGTPSSDYDSFTIDKVSAGGKYSFSSKGIAWPSDAEKYGVTTYNPTQISPPKDWIGRKYRNVTLKNTWAESGITFDPSTDEHFQVWMRTAGLPTFRKLYGRNADQPLPAGDYELTVSYNFGVRGYDGTKSIVISTTSFLGGRNPFLGISYIAVGCICLLLGIVFLVKHMVSPRKLGDHTYLSWNQQPYTPSPNVASK